MRCCFTHALLMRYSRKSLRCLRRRRLSLAAFTLAFLLYSCFAALLMRHPCFARDLLFHSCFAYTVAEPRLLYSCFTALLMLYSRRSLPCSRARRLSSDCRRLTKLRASTAGRIYAFWKRFFLFLFESQTATGIHS